MQRAHCQCRCHDRPLAAAAGSQATNSVCSCRIVSLVDQAEGYIVNVTFYLFSPYKLLLTYLYHGHSDDRCQSSSKGSRYTHLQAATLF